MMSVVSGAVWVERPYAVYHHDDLTAAIIKPSLQFAENKLCQAFPR